MFKSQLKPQLKSHYQIRVHAVITRAQADQDIRRSFPPEAVLELFQEVNRIYAPLGLQFYCDPDWDIECEPDPALNREDAKPRWQQRAMSHPGKLVVYFTEGDAGAPPLVRDYAYTCQGRGFAAARQLAHELGHYFHLEHTFVAGLTLQGDNGILAQLQQWLAAQPAAQAAQRDRHSLSPALIAAGQEFLEMLLDGDRDTIADTPAALHELPACLATPSTVAPIMPIPLWWQPQACHTYWLALDTTNIMSYSQGNDAIQFSPGQRCRIYEALHSGNRHHLLAYQLAAQT